MSGGGRRDGATDDDDDEDYEEHGGGNRFLGFMFGNVDDSGDLDADYLDEDVKEHLFALSDKLVPSLGDIELIKSCPGTFDPSEQDYDEKAEDAVDYEDIDEEYDGPEVEKTVVEDNVLPKEDYFSSNAVYALVNSTTSVFDEENYDEVDEPSYDIKFPVSDVVQNCSSVSSQQLVMAPSTDNLSVEKFGSLSHSGESMDFEFEFEFEFLQEDMGAEVGQPGSISATSLPVLCMEDGSVIQRFCEIFASQEPVSSRLTSCALK